MGVGAVLAELAVARVVEVLARLCLVVVVGNVHHLHLDVDGQWLQLTVNSKIIAYIVLAAELQLPMREMALVPYCTFASQFKVLAKTCLKQVRHRCLLGCHRRCLATIVIRVIHHHCRRVHLNKRLQKEEKQVR